MHLLKGASSHQICLTFKSIIRLATLGSKSFERVSYSHSFSCFQTHLITQIQFSASQSTHLQWPRDVHYASSEKQANVMNGKAFKCSFQERWSYIQSQWWWWKCRLDVLIAQDQFDPQRNAQSPYSSTENACELALHFSELNLNASSLKQTRQIY